MMGQFFWLLSHAFEPGLAPPLEQSGDTEL